MSKTRDDCRRVLTALRAGPVTPMDFDAPHVIDGGEPIRRVAARICDLRHKHGNTIDTTILRPSGVAQYTLIKDVGLSDQAKTEGPTHNAGLSTAVAQAGAPTGTLNRLAPAVETTPLSAAPPAGSGSLFDPDTYAPTLAHYEAEAA
jgi:hypothetical protein